MRERIGGILGRYGQTVTLFTEEGTVPAKAFLQPMARGREQVPEEMCSLGTLDGRLWLYLGQEAVRPGEQILWDGTLFRVRSSRAYHMGETQLYWWAALETEGETAE